MRVETPWKSERRKRRRRRIGSESVTRLRDWERREGVGSHFWVFTVKWNKKKPKVVEFTLRTSERVWMWLGFWNFLFSFSFYFGGFWIYELECGSKQVEWSRSVGLLECGVWSVGVSLSFELNRYGAFASFEIWLGPFTIISRIW